MNFLIENYGDCILEVLFFLPVISIFVWVLMEVSV